MNNDNRYKIYQGNTKDILSSSQQEIEDCSIDCVVTSPPYWKLRDYNSPDQLGQEATPQDFVRNLVEGVFGKVRRVLKDDGTVWLNLGDSYGSDKSLVGIPWMVAFAMKEAGWILRQDIIWSKPNPMPESVQDRCTKSHEYIFMFSKNRKYYYDNDAVKEPLADSSIARAERYQRAKEKYDGSPERPTSKHRKNGIDQSCAFAGLASGRSEGYDTASGMRNRRSVWTVSKRAFKDAHFAVYPPELIEPCILAGCPKGGVVLDPFSGSGTTGVVSINNGRNYIGIEINPAYIEMSHQRIENECPATLFSPPAV
jgi:DNA modification methylase